MARKKKSNVRRGKGTLAREKDANVRTEPQFPYTTKPASLRRLLKLIPQKPRPSKFDQNLLRAWGFTDANDYSMLRVLKSVGLLNDKNEPTDLYARYMDVTAGPRVMASEIRRVYAPMFQASHTPHKESSDKLQNLFNIHSGGGERTLEQQIQTFKALCEHTIFDDIGTASSNSGSGTPRPGDSTAEATGSNIQGAAAIHINLHIHLPENKSRRDYENIIEDIGRHIFGRKNGGERNE